MNRRSFLKGLGITAGTAAFTGFFNDGGFGTETNNIRWAMGWILWRGYNDKELKLTDAFQDLKDIGADGIELTLRDREFKKFNVTLEKVKQMLDEYDLKVSGHYFRDSFYDPSRYPEIRAELQQKIDSLKIFNARNIIIGPPKPPKQGDRREMIRAMGPVLDKLGEIALDQGVEIGIHPHLKSIIETPEDTHIIMDATDPRYVFMSPDTGHMHLGGGNVVELLTMYKERLNYFHFKDVAGSFKRPDFSTNLRELGQGEIDFPGIMRLLRDIGFKGWINVEQDKTALTPRISAQKSMDHVNDVLKPVYT